MSSAGNVSSANQPRSGSGSGRSQRSTNVRSESDMTQVGLTASQPDKQISQIEKSVTHLLVATKQLLETLTQWSRGAQQEEEVSDVYVRLGYEFNLACRAFNSIGVDTSDLGNVPDLLRHILEDTLSQPASPQALDNYLPRIRDIIINLLHGLKRKQSKLRGRPAGTSGDGKTVTGKFGPGRQGSVASTESAETGLTQMLDDVPSAAAASTRGPSREGVRSPEGDGALGGMTNSGSAGSLSRGSVNRHSVRRDQPNVQSESGSSMSSNTAQNLPVQGPHNDQTAPRPPSEVLFPHPPPPPPKQDALAALQRGGDLERRASRRFSAYQISKHLGASPNGVPVIPTAQHSPIPNRGREVRESMSAVRARGSYQRTRSNNRDPNGSPSRSGTVRAPQRISEEQEEPPTSINLQNIPKIVPPTDADLNDDSPIAKTPDEYFKPRSPGVAKRDDPMLSATINGPMSAGPEGSFDFKTPKDETPPPLPEHGKHLEPETSTPATVGHEDTVQTPPRSQIIDGLEPSPPQGKELTLFLQYKTKIKKFVLSEGYDELTLARLQLAFIEKFAWNTHNNNIELPEIYIQDPVSGVRHELEDLSDVKDRAVLVLNLEALDEVKKHFDEGMGGLQKRLDGFKSLLEGQGSMMQRFSDRQLEASKEMARMSAAPAPRSTPVRPTPLAARSTTSPPPSGTTIQEVSSLRRDIAVLRQTYSTMSSDFSSAMTDIKVKAAHVKKVAAEAAVPSYKGDAGRAHINKGKKQLSHDSEALISRVDDLADVVEELRKDVVLRGVRPLPRQLEDVSKEVSGVTHGLNKVKDFVKREKPVWTKIWEQELQMVMSEREDLTQRDEIIADLDGDLEDINDIFKLVEEATKQQNLVGSGQNAGGPSLRSTSRSLGFEPSALDPLQAKTGMLDEVRALEPNHENRLEAIERAEKARQRELQNREGGEFHQEVVSFVQDGRLRKTGGADEVERLRKVREEKARKEMWESVAAAKVERERQRMEKETRQQQYDDDDTGDGARKAEESVNDTSQEGDAAFQDASEVKLPSSDNNLSSYVGPDDTGDESDNEYIVNDDGSVTMRPKYKVTNVSTDGPPTLPEIPLSEDLDRRNDGKAKGSGMTLLDD